MRGRSRWREDFREELAAEREADREKRIQNMQQRAIRRLTNVGILAAWTKWVDEYECTLLSADACDEHLEAA